VPPSSSDLEDFPLVPPRERMEAEESFRKCFGDGSHSHSGIFILAFDRINPNYKNQEKE